MYIYIYSCVPGYLIPSQPSDSILSLKLSLAVRSFRSKAWYSKLTSKFSCQNGHLLWPQSLLNMD